MLLTFIYIVAITAEAMTGALSAGRRSMDWFGVVLIACVTALGGGSVRDVLLGHYPLGWVKHPEYLVLTCCAALFTILIAKWMKHLHSIFLLLDALGLIGFTIIGCQIALQMGHGFVVASVAGVLTGVSGGILRDILCNDIPLVFRRELYASISFVAVICYWVCIHVGLALEASIITTLAFGFTLRVIAIYFGLEMPKFIYQDDDHHSASSKDE
ncbi:trimeric intracellular cation channel family protein [Acinetobacter sp. MD2]|uniref:trimeric intracellular cation channel family protein n=1 Tax=Acinetobacter sp. MD2 TaxID=2600066 RepID=UPI002D1EA322|nr:trimeric intracellular cation channel family protein [Acinetobacter sp. MD2]MEB3766910.1 trimeric intracellular cation channel family protein [Acinetobacter sp. MD2]